MRKLIAVIVVAALICTVGAVQIFAAQGTGFPTGNFEGRTEGIFENWPYVKLFGRPDGKLEDKPDGRPERKYDSKPEDWPEGKFERKPENWQDGKFDRKSEDWKNGRFNGNLEDWKDGRFNRNLEDWPKGKFDKLPEDWPDGFRENFTDDMFKDRGKTRKELTDEQKAQMEAARAQCEEKYNEFIQSLTDEQKALYDAMKEHMVKPEAGKKPVMPDEALIQSMKDAYDAFIASLSELQKAAYDELFGAPGNMHGKFRSSRPHNGTSSYVKSI